MIATETLIIELLLTVSLVAIAVRRLRVPYTVALVVVGLVITFQQGRPIELTSEIILALFVPPIVFEAAFHIGLDRLRQNLLPILVLAVPGVLLTTLIVGLIASGGAGLPLTSALLFGALISATDPVAVVAVFRALGAPRQLTVLVEGESLLNDGTAIVVFGLVLAAATQPLVGSVPQPQAFDVLGAAVSFLWVSLGGVGLGLGLGWLTSQLIARLDDYLIETTLTTVLAFGSYLVAERIGVSGVLAVVGAGIVAGTTGPRTMSPTTRIVLVSFWEYLAFLANSLVFLLIGLDVNLRQILANLGPIAIAILAVLLSRALVVYGLTGLTNRLRGRKVPMVYQHVLFWGGLRGAVGLALVLGLPATLAERDLLRVMAYGVVLFTLLAQGTTMQPLLRRLGLLRQDEFTLEYERRQGRLMAVRAARDCVARLQREGGVSTLAAEELIAELNGRAEEELEAQRVLEREHPVIQEAERDQARRESLRAARVALATGLSDGAISEQVHDELAAEIDAMLDNTQLDKL
jgi:Na+:H+ antiporter